MKAPHLFRRQLYIAIAATMFITCVTAAPQVEAEEDTEQDVEQDIEQDVEQSQRDEKVFIALIQIPPDMCDTEDPTNILGTCLPDYECKTRGGTASGTCAKGLGSCCLITRGCNSETTLNNTYFISPERTNERDGACTLTINRATSDICQIRLDFERLHLAEPDSNGICSKDFLTISSGTTNVPMICGKNDGEHMYIDVQPDGGALKLTVDQYVNQRQRRSWNIKVSQIECDSRYRAPDGCLQYYTTTSGTVKSFNFANAPPETDEKDPLGTRQIADQDYGVCIKRAPDYCGIIWERDDRTGHEFSFTVSENVEVVPPDIIGTPDASSTGEACTTDYVVIPEGVDDNDKQADRYCGLGFPHTVTSTSTPFVLYVKTDGNETPDGNNRGFKLNYRQTSKCKW